MSEEKCEVGIVVCASGFQPDKIGSIPLPRSKDRRIGKWAECPKCKKIFASFAKHGKWKQHCSRVCLHAIQRELAKSLPKRKPKQHPPTGTCLCGNFLRGYKAISCRKCYSTNKKQLSGKKSLQEIAKSTQAYKSLHRWQPVRNMAKRVLLETGQEKKCFICAYSIHVEVCHIRSISDFSTESTMSEVNSPENLVYLCPNHHWELDNGVIKL